MTDDRIVLNEKLLAAMRAANKLGSMHPYKYSIVMMLSNLLDLSRAEVRTPEADKLRGNT